MKINRRQFLKGSAGSVAALGVMKQAGAMELALGNASYNYIKREPRERVFTCSPLHAHDNPVIAWVEQDPLQNNLLTGKPGRLVVELSGVTESVRSRGRVSAAEAAAWLQLYDGDRLRKPLKRAGPRGSGKWQEISWQQAYQEIAQAIAKSKPEAIALLHGKDTSAGIWQRYLHTLGSNTFIPLSATANRQAAWRAAWGEPDTIPDLAHSHYILNFGTNFLVSQPDYAAEAMDGRLYRRAKIVTFDPRCSKTAGLSDEWLPLRPGTDGVVALAMANYLLQEGLANKAAIARSSNLTVDRLAKELKQYTLEQAAKLSGVEALSIRSVARQFAESERGCILTGAGTSGHTNGYDTERALMLLPLITGGFEVQGGNCLPRRIALGDLLPKPASPAGENPIKHPHRFPLEAGKQYPVDVLFGYNTNPAFDAPAAAAWRQTLADESRVKLFVAIDSFRNETWDLADLILPEAHWLERNEPVVGQGSLLPWIGLRQQVSKPIQDAKELREILRDIVRAGNDPEAGKYWQFADTHEWLAMQLGGVPGLNKDGGWELMAKHSGVWPIYGYLHPEIRRIVDEQGEEVLPHYGKPVKLDLDPFPHWQAAKDTSVASGELTLVVHASDYYAGDASANNKVVREATLANHLHINYATATAMAIEDGDLVRVSSQAGYLVTKAHLTQTIRPDVVAMHSASGHWRIGGVANGSAGPEREGSGSNPDEDINHNLWWADPGTRPMDLIPARFDEQGGGAAYATAVTVKKAASGDEYGKVSVNAAKLLADGDTAKSAQEVPA
ncbi:acetylene hydratase [mine drainage metagenome]|uniref:Acetylene hydratase n=1 Tax=mine drainage metagenome TaxID=410659 RepID=A0A1J5RSX5_9ZZZZ